MGREAGVKEDPMFTLLQCDTSSWIFMLMLYISAIKQGRIDRKPSRCSRLRIRAHSVPTVERLAGLGTVSMVFDFPSAIILTQKGFWASTEYCIAAVGKTGG